MLYTPRKFDAHGDAEIDAIAAKADCSRSPVRFLCETKSTGHTGGSDADCTLSMRSSSTSGPMKPLVIYGAGGYGREVAWIACDINSQRPTWDLLGFLDNNAATLPKTVCGFPVLGTAQWLAKNPRVHVALAIGDPKARAKIARSLQASNMALATLIHPTTILPRHPRWETSIGRGTIVGANVVINTRTAVGDCVIINKCCTIGHDVVVQDFASIMPLCSVSGSSRIQRAAFVGTGANIIEHVNVGCGAVIGAGSVVISDIPAGCTAVGVPAKVVKWPKPEVMIPKL